MDNSNDNNSDTNSQMDFDESILHSPGEQTATSTHWTEQDVTEMRKLVEYYTDMITYVTKCRKTGPSSDQPPKNPSSQILKKLYIRKTAGKGDNTSIAQMSGEEFNYYLESKVSSRSDEEVLLTQIPHKLSELPLYLDQTYKNLQHAEHNNLKAHFQMGKSLNIAKDKFDCEKRKKRMRETWRIWIEQNTEIKEACARRHREIASIVSKYPKLENLSISYADFLKIKNKINEVFAENVQIGEKWK